MSFIIAMLLVLGACGPTMVVLGGTCAPRTFAECKERCGALGVRDFDPASARPPRCVCGEPSR